MDMNAKEKLLANFAKNTIPPSDEAIKNANVQMDKVFKLFQRKSKYPLDRFIVGGSAGKHTCTQSFDYDCVVFVNGEQPNFEDVLNDFEDVLLMAESLDIKTIKKTPYSVQFEVNNIEFDLLPAVNLVSNPRASSDERIRQQQLRVIKMLDSASFGTHSTFEKMKKLYSSSLVESHVEFMKNQDAFAHELARLAKFWTKTLFFNSYINGKSTIIELIAVDAARKTVAKGKPNFTDGFKLFLEQMTKLNSLLLTFEEFWPPIQNKGLIYGFRSPVILEPNNPYNNLGDSLNTNMRGLLKKYAKETLERINHNRWTTLEELFEPQPTAVKMTLPKPDGIIVGIHYERKELSPSLMDRRKTSLRTPGESMFIRMVQDRLFISTQSYASRQAVDADSFEEFIEKVIDINIMNEVHQKWTDSEYEHEDFDYTMVIPYDNLSTGEKEFVVVSFDFEK